MPLEKPELLEVPLELPLKPGLVYATFRAGEPWTDALHKAYQMGFLLLQVGDGPDGKQVFERAFRKPRPPRRKAIELTERLRALRQPAN